MLLRSPFLFYGEEIMKNKKPEKIIKKIRRHLEGDIKTFESEKKEDKELLKKMKKKKKRSKK